MTVVQDVELHMILMMDQGLDRVGDEVEVYHREEDARDKPQSRVAKFCMARVRRRWSHIFSRTNHNYFGVQ